MKNKPDIIIWGYLYGTHTHSSIWNGFYKAFKYLGYKVKWIDDDNIYSSDQFKNCVFLTEGNSCKYIPKRKDCKYILHNCTGFEGLKYVNIQYLTKEYKDAPEISHGIKLINDDMIMFAWGSDLLPHEFDESLLTKKRDNKIYYLGTVDHQGIEGGNFKPISEFAKEASKYGYELYYGGGYSTDLKLDYMKFIEGWISEKDQKKYLTTGYAMPALQGDRQLVNGMIPCRLFKAIQFGMDGISNNEFANEFFDQQIIYFSNIEELFQEAERRKDDIERKRWLFNFVKEKHTYVNNVKAIMNIL
jgi:hypothetical protein